MQISINVLDVSLAIEMGYLAEGGGVPNCSKPGTCVHNYVHLELEMCVLVLHFGRLVGCPFQS